MHSRYNELCENEEDTWSANVSRVIRSTDYISQSLGGTWRLDPSCKSFSRSEASNHLIKFQGN